MTDLEATFTDISSWYINIHYSTGGTRNKYIALHPETYEEYFFKGSKETPSYPTEFWSEIVASKIGQMLGFPMLDYNIAYNKQQKQKIGCFSKSMILSSENKLTEGISYLTGFNAHYNPKKDKKDYTFQFICKALDEFSLGNYIGNIIEIIVFDCIIGNSDRHQENWGIITYYHEIMKAVEEEIKKSDSSFLDEEKNQLLVRKIIDKGLINNDRMPHKFAPIYDSGCCLAREHIDEKVFKMLNDSQMIEKYIENGRSEIHWEGHPKKRTHFELIELLLKDYPDETRNFIVRIKEKYNSEVLKTIIENIDTNVPKKLINFKLSETRKKLMFKLVTLRIEKLIQYL